MAHFPGKIHCNFKQNKLERKLQVRCNAKCVNDEQRDENYLRIANGLKTFYLLFRQDDDDEKSFDGFSIDFIHQRRHELLNSDSVPDPVYKLNTQQQSHADSPKPETITESKLKDASVLQNSSDNSLSSCESVTSQVSNSNSANRKDAIKRNMVSRYAEIMMSETTNGISENAGDKPENSERSKVASKIERLLKSQWEDRLKKKEVEEDGKRSASPTVVPTSGGCSAPSSPEPIIRKAKLQLNNKTLLKLRQPSSLKHLIFDEPKSNSVANESDTPLLNNKTQHNRSNNGNNCTVNNHGNANNKKRSSNGGRPGFITCAICNITKYYSHVQRRHGQYSCEPCSKFFARFCRNPKQFFCSKNGDCPISVNQVPISTPNKCRACWLKLCLQKFIIDPSVRAHISSNFAPKLESSPNVSLITVDTSHGNSFSPSIAKESSSLLMLATSKQSSDNNSRKRSEFRTKNGPRVKRVCRSVDVIKGLPRATFSSLGSFETMKRKDDGNVSVDSCEDEDDDNDSDDLPIDVYLHRAYEKEMRKSDSADSEFDLSTGVVNGISEQL